MEALAAMIAVGISHWCALGTLAASGRPGLARHDWQTLIEGDRPVWEFIFALDDLSKEAPELADNLTRSWLRRRRLPQSLDLRDSTWLTSLPYGLAVDGDLFISGCRALRRLPSELVVTGDLDADKCKGLRLIPAGVRVAGDLWAPGCTALERVRTANVGGSLILPGCRALVSLPANLSVGGTMNLGGCASLRHLPIGLKVVGDLVMDGCRSWDGRIPKGAAIGGAIRR
jgi:hypothetical protein